LDFNPRPYSTAYYHLSTISRSILTLFRLPVSVEKPAVLNMFGVSFKSSGKKSSNYR
jgi:hypothetical protein